MCIGKKIVTVAFLAFLTAGAVFAPSWTPGLGGEAFAGCPSGYRACGSGCCPG